MVFKNLRGPNTNIACKHIACRIIGIHNVARFIIACLLYQNSVMIMSGYGWGDDPINNRLMTWLDKKKENKLVLLHRDPSLLMNRSLVFDRDYSNWVDKGKLKPIGKWLSDTRLEEVLEACS